MKTKGKEVAQLTPHRELSVLDEMDRMFDSFFRRGWLRSFRDMWPEWTELEDVMDLRSPRIDLIDRDTELLVKAEIPGVKRDDLRVDLTGDRLTIRGEHRREETAEEGSYVRSEITRGAFSRTIRLPEDVNADQVKADFKDGILEVHLPKLEKTERKRIEIV